MKSLPNSTNGVMVLSDAFTTSIFKQSFLRVFTKDEQGNLEMGFNATFDVQVELSPTLPLPEVVSDSVVDHKRTQSFGLNWTCYVRQQKISLCRRNGDWYWPDISVEHQCLNTQNLCCRLLRGRNTCWPAITTGVSRTHPIRHSLPTFLRRNEVTSDHRRSQFCRGWFTQYRRFVRPGGCRGIDVEDRRFQSGDRRFPRCPEMVG